MRLAHRAGISLGSAWRKVKAGYKAARKADPARKAYKKTVHYGRRGGKYWSGPTTRRYDPMARRKRSGKRRRYDPARIGGGFGGKLIYGFLGGAAAILGRVVGPYINSAVPQASIAVTSSKSVNLVTYAVGSVGSGFTPKSGIVGALAQGLFHGIAAGSDPAASALGGGAVQYGGTTVSYGTVGV
jgi:hypothetical protein